MRPYCIWILSLVVPVGGVGQSQINFELDSNNLRVAQFMNFFLSQNCSFHTIAATQSAWGCSSPPDQFWARLKQFARCTIHDFFLFFFFLMTKSKMRYRTYQSIISEASKNIQYFFCSQNVSFHTNDDGCSKCPGV